MTTSTLPSPTTLPAKTVSPSTSRPNLLQACLYSVLIYLFPHPIRKQWLKISTLQAIIVAIINLLLAPVWFMFLYAAYLAHENSQLRVHLALMGELVPHPVRAYFAIFRSIPHLLSMQWNHRTPLQTFEHIFAIVGASLSAITAFAILYFILLPFAAKPGPNKPAALHNLRAVLLSTGWIHIWFPILTATFLFIFDRIPPDLENYLAPLSAILIILTLWTLAALITAVRADYRKSPQHFPQPHDPWCEECGYNLIASDPQSRCPECGTSIPQSLGQYTRPPTPWEQNPSLLNLKTIRHQIAQLYTRPRQLFFSMPTLSGQPAAQRWLLASAFITGLLATFILPIGKILGIYGEWEWSWNLLFGSLFVGLTWAILALMMVGIETAGIATFSKIRAKRETPGGPGGVYLAASAKVTAYSSTLMLPWVLLGGGQLLAAQFWDFNHFTQHFHLSLRTEQILLAGSLSLAHIGGLLWYELTVYRGIKAIQYANK